MRVLITGGAGFIGSNFIRYILKNHPDYRIINLDKLTYAGNLENLADLDGEPRHEFTHGDICDPSCVRAVLAGGVDAVVNFAAETHVDRSILDSREFVRTNIEGTRNLLDISRANKIPRYVQISTDEVYGSLGDFGAFTENTPIAPNSPYSASKASADMLVRSYCHTYGFPAVITRSSNNYGPYQFPEKLIPVFISNVMADVPLPLFGDGMNVRDWIHVEDHCAAIDVVLHHGRAGSVYNVGGHEELPNIEVAKRILTAFGKDESLLTYVKDRPGHDRRYAIDSTKLETELGWKPRIVFRDGLRETIAWYRRNASWVEHVRSGAYLKYYDEMYGRRDRTFSDN